VSDIAVIYFESNIHNKRFLYQSLTLYNSGIFIEKHRAFAKEELDDDIINEIIDLKPNHPIYKYFKTTLPELFEATPDSTLELDLKSSRNLAILFYHLKGFSQELIAEILEIKSRGTVSTVLKDFKSVKKMDLKKFKVNCSVSYYSNEKKIIESKYYNKYCASDFHYIS